MKFLSIGIIILAAVLTLVNSAFLLPEGQQALITQFGEVKGQPITKAGLKFKIPFVQDVRYFDKRILSWDGDADKIPTKDKKYIWVDTTARWKISDPLKFTKALKNENIARSNIDDILDGITRDIISNFNLVEAVRNSNSILDTINKRKEEKEISGEKKELHIDDSNHLDEEITGEISSIKAGREKLTDLIIVRAKKILNAYGIELIDVQLRSISYDDSVQNKVYQRMISERERIAEKIRSYGQGELQKIQGKLNRDLKQIESVAYRKSQEIRGRAEAEAIEIYAKSFGSDPGFYEFSKNLELYKKTLSAKGEFILSTDSYFLKLLGKGP
ncbi:MAG: protease modulator HflC [Bdellovibrionota bacterium]